MKRLYIAFMMVLTIGGTGLVFAEPAAACSESAFAVPAWYKGLLNPDCSVKSPDAVGGINKFVTILGLNIIQALMVVVAYITIFFIIKGGFNYMTSTGSPDGMANARKTITNAAIGMLIAILAASIVNAVAGVIK